MIVCLANLVTTFIQMIALEANLPSQLTSTMAIWVITYHDVAASEVR